MFNKFIKKSSKLIAVVLAITLAFSPLSYGVTPTTFADLGIEISKTVSPQVINLANDITADTMDTTLGTQGSSKLVINGYGHYVSGAEVAEGFEIGSGRDTTVSDITFKNFYDYAIAANSFDGMLDIQNTIFESNSSEGDGGGAMYINSSGKISITGSKFKSNSAEVDGGGAIYTMGTGSGSAFMTITDSKFDLNSASEKWSLGGAIFNDIHFITTITSSTFNSNSADSSGAIFNGGTMSITGSTFESNSASADGGAILNDGHAGGGTMSITDSIFNSNRGNSGGAILNDDGTTIITSSTFNLNSANSGGAILNDGTMSITDSKFNSNRGNSGGAIFNDGTMSITGSTFESNSASADGGAITNNNAGKLIIGKNVKFSSNTTTKSGGAIYINDANSEATIGENSKFSYNEALGTADGVGGGAIYNDKQSVLNIGQWIEFLSNTAGKFGGAIYNNTGTINIEDNVKFVSNYTTASTGNDHFGGAIYNLSGLVTIGDNVEFSSNVATMNGHGGAVYNKALGNMAGVDIGENATFSYNVAKSGGAIDNDGRMEIGSGAKFYFNDTSSYSGGQGGAIYNYGNGTTLIFTGDAIFDSNKAQNNGGAIVNDRGELIIGENSIFSSNEAITGNGGAIYNFNSGNVTVGAGTSFLSNAGGYGGAIYNNSGSVTVEDNVNFSTNTATKSTGGAIHNQDTITIGNNVEFSSNAATGSSNPNGGAIFNSKNITIGDGAVFSYNSAAGNYGGAIHNSGTNSKVIIGNNAFFHLNTAAGSNSFGGAINNEGTLTIGDNVEFSSNTANRGGAVFNKLNSVTDIGGNSKFFYNNATYGGAIDNDSKITIGDGAVFSSNTATQGGALYNYINSTVTFSGSVTFDSNTATSIGGAIYNDENGKITIGNADSQEIRFSSNTSLGQAGAIYNKNSTMTITATDIIFASNTAKTYGGAIVNEGAGSYIKIDNVNTAEFSYNGAQRGGAVDNYNKANIVMGSNINFSSNTANAGGAIFNEANSTIKLGDNINFNSNTVTKSEENPGIIAGGGAIWNNNSAIITIGDNVSFTSNSATTSGGAIYNVNNSTITIGDNVKFKGNKNSDDNFEGGAIHNEGTLSIGSAEFEDNYTNEAKRDIYNIGDLTLLGDTTMTGGISNGNRSDKGITTISENISLTVGEDATFRQNKVIVGNGASWTLNVELNQNNFKITDKVINQGGNVYINGDGDLAWVTEGIGEYYYNGNINIIGDTLEHSVMHITGDNNTVTRGQGTNTTVNSIDGENGIFNNNGTLVINLANSSDYTLKTLESTENTGTTEIKINSNNIELNLENKTIQQKTLTLSGTKSAKLSKNKIEADLENKLGNGLTLEDTSVTGQIINNTGEITILGDFEVQNGITSDYNATRNILNIGNAGKAAVVTSTNTIEYQTINISSGNLTLNKDNEEGSISNSYVTVTENGKLTANASNVKTVDKKINNAGILELTGGRNENEITGEAGTLEISGNVENLAGTAINQKTININESNSFTAKADDITATDGIKNDGTFNITGGTVSGYDVIGTSTETSKVNIKDNVIIAAGKTITNNTVTLEESKKLTLAKEDSLNTSTLEINNESTLDIKNGEIGTVGADIRITGANWNLKLDVNLGGDTLTADSLNITDVVSESNALITDIGFLGSSNIKAEQSVQITNKNINANILPSIMHKIINDINYEITTENTETGTYLKITAYGYGGLARAVYDSKSLYEVELDRDTTTAWILGDDTIKTDMVIKGNNKVLTSTTSLSGIKTGTNKLTVEDLVEYSGFNNTLTVAANGKLIISTVTFKSNTGEAVITNEGTTTISNVTFSGNSADTDVANNGALNISGTGAILEKGISGTGTTTIESGATLENGSESTIAQTAVTNSGTVTNAGTVNATTLTNNASSTITNSGTITGTDNTITNKGELTNGGEISAKKVANEANATITNETAGIIRATTFSNTGTVDNSGTIKANRFTNYTNSILTNTGTIESENTIGNKGIITSNADNMKAAIENIGTYNVTGGTISYKVTGVSGNNGTINIRENEVTVNTSISNNNINLGTTLKVNDDRYLESTSTLVIENGALLITDNGTVSNIAATVNIADGAKWGYQLDVDLENVDDEGYGKADKLKIGNVGANSEATISSIHLNKDKATKTTVVIADDDINANIAGNINIYTTTLKYKVTSRVDEDGNTVLDIEADGYGGLASAVYEGASSYSLTEYADYLTAWIVNPDTQESTNFLKADLDIEGNNNVLMSTTSAKGIETRTNKLKVSNLEKYTGFENAITVNNGGSLVVSTVTFTGNKGIAVITNEGTTELSNVTFSENTADIDVANNGTLNVAGAGATLEKGISGTGTMTIGEGAELVNGAESTISQKDITVSGTLINSNETSGAISTTEKVSVGTSGKVTTNATAISATGGIDNEGLVVFNGGTNANVISGTAGELVIDGTVTNEAAIEQKKVIITAEKSLTTSADNVTTSEEITNAGTLTYTGGTNNNIISGTSGTLNVEGALTNNKNVSQDTINIKDGMFTNDDGAIITVGTGINIEETAGLTTNAGNINASAPTIISNKGNVIFTGGKNVNEITGDMGALEISGTVENDANVTQGEVIVDTTGKLTNDTNRTISATNMTNSGEITNEGTITSENAIANSGTLTSKADDIEISGTTKEINNTGTFNINGGILSGYDVAGGNVNIKDNVTVDGKKIKNSAVTLENNKTLTLAENNESALNSSTLEITDGATLNIQNGSIGTVGADVSITGANWNLKLDVNVGETSTSDFLNIIAAGASSALIEDINFIEGGTSKAEETVQITNKNINATVNGTDNFIYETINGIYYQITTENTDTGTFLKLTAYGYGGLANAIYDEEESYDVIPNDTVTAWIDGKNVITKNMVINGGDNTLTATPASGTLEGMIVSDNKKLTINNLTKFEQFNNALTVAANGELVISTVTFTGNSGEAVITNEGTTELSNVTFSENTADIDVANNGTLNVAGAGATLEKGISGTGTMTIGEGAELVNGADSTINQKDITVSGILTNNNGTDNAITVSNKINVNADAILTSSANAISATNGIVNAGTVTFTGGTNTNNITGDGELNITGAVENSNSIKQGKITIVEDASLISDVNNIKITEEISNAGDLTFTGEGTTKNIITGTGTTIFAEESEIVNTGTVNQGKIDIQGTLTNNNETSESIKAADKITVGDDGVFATNANAVIATNGIVNAGTVTFTGGTNKNEITGDTGRLEITGTVENAAYIEQDELEITTNGKLTNDAEKTIKATMITNSGTTENEGTITADSLINNENAIVENEGTLTAENVTNNGTLSNEAGATLTADESIINSGTINNESGAEITVGTLTNSGTISSTGTIKAENITNDEDAKIVNEGTIESTNAIANAGTITSNADNMKAEINNSGEYNITGGTVSYKITGNNGTINIKDGEVTIDTSISNNDINLTGTTLKLNDESYLEDTTTLIIGEGATLNTQNEQIGNVVAPITVASGINWNYQLDLNVQEESADMLTNITAESGSQATINDIKFLTESNKAETTIQISESNIYAITAPDIYTTNIKYKVTAENTDDGTFLNLVAEGYGGLANAIYDGATSYSITEDVDYVTAWIEQPEGVTNNFLKEDLIIHGNDSVLTSTTGVVGINVDTHTLTIEDLAEMSGFENAITVEKIGESSGTATITNVTFTDNTGDAVITNAGTVTLSSVTFNGNQTDTDIANNGELIITGEDTETVLDKGITGEGNTTIDGGATLINGENSTIEQDEVTIDGILINDNDSLEAITANDIAIGEDGSLVTDASAIRAENGIDSDGLITFTGGTNRNEITGDGEINIVGDVINSESVQQSTVTVAQDASLTTDASNIETTIGITNNGDLIFTGGENNNAIIGEGDLTIEGDVTNNEKIEQETITVTEDGRLVTDAGNLVTENKIANAGEMEFTGGTNINTITGEGSLEITGDVINSDEGNIKQSEVTITEDASLQTNVNNIVATEGITNEGEMTYIGEGTNKNEITGDGNLTIEGTVINSTGTAISQSSVTVNGSFTANADDITTTDGIANDGTLTYTGGTNDSDISGDGETVIAGDVTNSDGTTIDQDKITVNDNAEFTTNIGDVITDSGIENSGDMIFIGEGENSNVITGSGNLTIEGTVTNDDENGSIEHNTITISKDGSLTINADNIVTNNEITNSGDLEFTGGTNENKITGDGDLKITGDVINDDDKGNIKQTTVKIDEGASLETNVNNIAATDGITNKGEMTYTGEGTNKNEITGNGNLTIDGEVENYIGTTISQTSMTVTDGSGFKTRADDITTTDGIANDGTLTFTGGTNNNEITMSDGAKGKLVVEDNLTNQANITQKEIEITGGDFDNVRTSSITAEKITVAGGSSLITDAADLDISDSITLTGESTLLNLKDDSEAEISAKITGAGKIVKEGEGTVTLSGDNSYTGTTTITGGAIEIIAENGISENTIYMDGGKLIINSDSEAELGNEIIGTDHNDVNIEVTGADTTLTGEILGNENLVKTGSGILDLQMKSNSYAGDTMINEGGIRGTTSNINGKVIGSGDENSSVEFYDEDGEVTLNEIVDMGTFDKTGAATMTVTNNFKSINANITNGTFVINNDAEMGGSGSTFEVTDTMKLTNSTLKGYGDITTGDLIIGKDASLAPGNSTTTFKVNGNLIFEDNGNYDVEFGQFSMDEEGHYNDNTQVSGTTTIGEDATITLNNLEGKYYVKETIELINSGTLADGYEYKEGNVEFNDNDATDLRPGYDTRISTRVYTEGNVLKIDLQRKQSEYGTADFDKSHNEQEAADAIDAVSTGNGGDITLPLDVLEHFYYYEDPETGEANIPALKEALNDVAGVIHSNAMNLTFFNSKAEHVYDKIKERTSDCNKIHDRMWAEYYYNTYSVDKDSNSPKYETTTNGFLVGFDLMSSKIHSIGDEYTGIYKVTGKDKAKEKREKPYKVTGVETASQWMVGVMAGYGTNELKQRKDKATMDDINLGFYGGYENDKWVLKGMLLGGYESYTIDRTIGFMNRMANSEHHGYSAALDMEAGYKIGLTDNQARHKVYLKPFIGALGSYINSEEYKEKGADSLNLKIARYDAAAAEARAGLELNGRVKKFGWYAKAGVRQLLTKDYKEVKLSLLDFEDDTKMYIRSAENATTSLTGGIGADYDLSENWTIFANGLGNFADVSTNYYANVGLAYRFGCRHNEKKTDGSEELRKMLEERMRAEEELKRKLAEKEKELAALRAKEAKEKQDRENALNAVKEKEKELEDYKARIVSEQQAQQMKEKTIKTMRISGPTFKFGTTQLSADGKGKLKDVAQELKNNPKADVLIEGHTDSVGSDGVNQKLSEQRASSVATSLKKEYKVPNDISVIGKGEKEPIASNDTAAGRAKNRRVEIILTTAE